MANLIEPIKAAQDRRAARGAEIDRQNRNDLILGYGLVVAAALLAATLWMLIRYSPAWFVT
jgi:hypothetical protein